MNGAKSVAADFDGTSDTFNITASTSGGGSIAGAGLQCRGTGSGCTSPQAANATVTLTARPDAGATFSGWGGACTGTATTCSVHTTQALTLTATFTSAAPSTQTLTVAVTGAGRVRAGTKTCIATATKPATCSQQITTGETVTLTATPAAGYTFAGWKGACSGSKSTCTVTLSASAAVEATFAQPLLATGKKPRVVAAGKGLRVTLYFTAREPGKLTLVATRSGKKALSVGKTAKKGAGTLVVRLKQRGRYVLTLTLTSQSGKWSVRWVVKH
jgi:uncharacterized repeat protein (TIGR02543 family)